MKDRTNVERLAPHYTQTVENFLRFLPNPQRHDAKANFPQLSRASRPIAARRQAADSDADFHPRRRMHAKAGFGSPRRELIRDSRNFPSPVTQSAGHFAAERGIPDGTIASTRESIQRPKIKIVDNS